MTCRVTRIRHEFPVSEDIKMAVSDLDAAMVAVINAAEASALPQGLIVGLLHRRTHIETLELVVE